MRSNIPKLYLANFLTGLVFWYGIEKLFMQSIGITTVGIAINAITYVVVSTALNIPAGILADKWSRKYTLMLGISALLLGTAIMANSHNVFAYICGTAVWGLYIAFTEGTYQAILYDSLVEDSREKQYVKHQGRSYGLFLVGVSISSVIGGYVANHYGYRSTYWLTVATCLVCLLLLCSLHEPHFHKEVSTTKMWQHFKRSFDVLHSQQLLRYLSVIFIGINLLGGSQAEYAGLYYIALGFGAIGSGWANAGMWLFGSFGHFLAERLGSLTRWFIPLSFLLFMAFTLVHSPIGLLFFYVTNTLQSVAVTNIEAVIQHHTPSSVRATTISALTFLQDAILIPTSLVFGYLAKHSIFQAYQVVGYIGLCVLAVWLLRPKALKQITLRA